MTTSLAGTPATNASACLSATESVDTALADRPVSVKMAETTGVKGTWKVQVLSGCPIGGDCPWHKAAPCSMSVREIVPPCHPSECASLTTRV